MPPPNAADLWGISDQRRRSTALNGPFPDRRTFESGPLCEEDARNRKSEFHCDLRGYQLFPLLQFGLAMAEAILKLRL